VNIFTYYFEMYKTSEHHIQKSIIQMRVSYHA